MKKRKEREEREKEGGKEGREGRERKGKKLRANTWRTDARNTDREGETSVKQRVM